MESENQNRSTPKRPHEECVCAKSFSHFQLFATLCTVAHQAPPSLGFSRQEHWSGLPFPPPMHGSEKWKWSRSVVSDSSWPHGLQPTRILHPWDFPGKSTGVGCHCLLQIKSLTVPKAESWNSSSPPIRSSPTVKVYCCNWTLSPHHLGSLKKTW